MSTKEKLSSYKAMRILFIETFKVIYELDIENNINNKNIYREIKNIKKQYFKFYLFNELILIKDIKC